MNTKRIATLVLATLLAGPLFFLGGPAMRRVGRSFGDV
jgi:hypothetical protein